MMRFNKKNSEVGQEVVYKNKESGEKFRCEIRGYNDDNDDNERTINLMCIEGEESRKVVRVRQKFVHYISVGKIDF